MATSVYDWMLARKCPTSPPDGDIVPTGDDVLVRILRALDAEASRAPVSSN